MRDLEEVKQSLMRIKKTENKLVEELDRKQIRSRFSEEGVYQNYMNEIQSVRVPNQLGYQLKE